MVRTLAAGLPLPLAVANGASSTSRLASAQATVDKQLDKQLAIAPVARSSDEVERELGAADAF